MSVPEEQAYLAPPGLNEQQLAAYTAVMQYLTDRDLLWSGGQHVFKSPAQWSERNEEFGLDSLLIVLHDGGQHRPAFYVYEGIFERPLRAGMDGHLRSQGFRIVNCTCWYSAIYPL